MLLKDPVPVETRCPRLWSMLVAGGLASLAVLVSGFGYRAEASADDTIVIIIRPQGEGAKSQTEKPQTVRFFTVPPEQKKAEEKKVKIRVTADPQESGNAKVEEKRFINIDVVDFEELADKDDLALLQNVLKRLEVLKKDGKLTNERIEAEVLKALGQMKTKFNIVPVEGGKDKNTPVRLFWDLRAPGKSYRGKSGSTRKRRKRWRTKANSRSG